MPRLLPTDLPGLAQLTQQLAGAARAPGVLVYVDATLEPTAWASTGHGPAQIHVAADLLEDHALEAVLAHEIAHVALDHEKHCLPYLLLSLSKTALAVSAVAGVASALGSSAGGWTITAALTAVVALAAYLLQARMMRAQEYEADAYAALMLDAIGRDGKAAVGAALWQAHARDSQWYRLAGWVVSSHPPAIDRYHRLTAGYGVAA